MPLISALKRLRLGDHKLQASLGYIVRPCFKNQINKEDLIKLRDPVWSFHHVSQGKKKSLEPKSENSFPCVYSGVTLTWLFQRNYHKDINTYQVSTTIAVQCGLMTKCWLMVEWRQQPKVPSQILRISHKSFIMGSLQKSGDTGVSCLYSTCKMGTGKKDLGKQKEAAHLSKEGKETESATLQGKPH